MVKKLILVASTLAISAALSISAMAGWHHGSSHHGSRGYGGVCSNTYTVCTFVDANGDGICDNCSGQCLHTVTNWNGGCHGHGCHG